MLHRKYDPTNTITAVAAEAIPANSLVRLDSNGQFRLAVATSAANYAVGFVPQAAAVGERTTAYRLIQISNQSGLTPGHRVFLSASSAGSWFAGADASTINTANHIIQPVGVALDANTILFDLTHGFFLVRQAAGNTTISLP